MSVGHMDATMNVAKLLSLHVALIFHFPSLNVIIKIMIHFVKMQLKQTDTPGVRIFYTWTCRLVC